MKSTATATASPSAAASSSRRNRRATRQQQSSSADSVGSGSGGTATTTQATTAAEAARAARRNRIAGTGIPTSPGANAASGVSSASSGGGGINKPAIGSGSGNRRVGGSPSAAEVAAAFEDLGMPSKNGTGGNSSDNAKQNGAAVGINGTSVNGRDRASAGTSTRSGSVRRSGNTILSSGAAAGSSNANATNAAAGSGTRVAMPSPQDVADEFVGRQRLQQQHARQQQQQGPAGMDVTMSNAQNANAARNNNSLRESTTTPIRSRNTAAVKNYVASSTNNASTTSTATSMKAKTTTTTTTPPTRYAMVESPSKTRSTSNRRQPPLRVDTHSGTRSANGTTATPHSVASPDETHLRSVNSSELGSLASPAASSTVADSLAYSRNTSKDSSGFGGLGGGGLGDDILSGRATNDIPATTTAAKMMSNGDSGVASAGDGEWARSNAVRQHDSTQPQPQPQPRLQMRNGTQSTGNAFGATGSTLTADSVDDNFDDGTHGGGSITSRYDDLSKLSSRYSRPDRVMAPVDERPQLANPNGTSRSFDSYENKSHATHATAITYGQHDTNGAVGGGGGPSISAGNGGGSAKRDLTSIDVVTQSFSPTQKGSAYPSSQASVGTSRPNGTFDDEDTNTIGSQLTDDRSWCQLTDDRSWSRSVNLRQQQLRAQGRDYDDDADSRGSRRRGKSGKKGGKDASGEGDLTGWALNADDMNHFKEQVDQPQVKAALGASAAVVAGAAIFGPAGVLLGAAAVGLGVGVMQMPEDQREQIKEKATAAAQQTFESAQIAADAMGTTCATACVESGVAEKIDPKFGKFVEDGAHNGCGTTIAATDLVQHNLCAPMEGDTLSPLDGDSAVGDAAGASNKASNSAQNNGANESGAEDSGSENQMPKRRRKVACMRKGRIVSLGQIHSLDPNRQPKAWLDVMASANTTRDEKDEAMEELSIFIKDKYTAHALLDEGILDSLLYIIACFFRTQGSAILKESPDGIMPMSVRSDPDFLHAKKAANCCVNLGKAHCAIVHTEADDLLMSAYSNGAVPIERQLAQMLHEVPHHTSLPMTPANKQSAEGGDVTPSSDVVFTLTELSLQHAERLSISILALSQGRIVL